MIIQKQDIPGLLLITPKIFHDERGFFLEIFRYNAYDAILGVEFVQDNMSFSHYGTVRGLHFQKEPHAQAKLVRCVLGRILDVALDIRPDSSTFGRHLCVELDDKKQQQFFLPAGFAHGFSVLSPQAIVEYKCDAYYEASSDAGLRFDDSFLSIDWKIPSDKMLISAKDASLPTWKQYLEIKDKK